MTTGRVPYEGHWLYPWLKNDADRAEEQAEAEWRAAHPGEPVPICTPPWHSEGYEADPGPQSETWFDALIGAWVGLLDWVANALGLPPDDDRAGDPPSNDDPEPDYIVDCCEGRITLADDTDADE